MDPIAVLVQRRNLLTLQRNFWGANHPQVAVYNDGIAAMDAAIATLLTADLERMLEAS